MKNTPTPNPYRPHKDFIEKSVEITYQSQVSFITEAIKLGALANGGAAIALMTYLGAVAKSENTAATPSIGDLIALIADKAATTATSTGATKPEMKASSAVVAAAKAPAATALSSADLVSPILFFAGGIVLSFLAFVAAYFAQMSIMKYWNMSQGVTAIDDKTKAYLDGHVRGFKPATLLILASIIAFAGGVISAGAIFGRRDQLYVWTWPVALGLIVLALMFSGYAALFAKIDDPAALFGSPPQTPKWKPHR